MRGSVLESFPKRKTRQRERGSDLLRGVRTTKENAILQRCVSEGLQCLCVDPSKGKDTTEGARVRDLRRVACAYNRRERNSSTVCERGSAVSVC